MVTVYSNMVEKMADNHDEEEHLARGKITRTFGEITFSSNFDSGNLDKVEECHSDTADVLSFNLWTAPDCAGTRYENGNRSWYYYSVTTQPNSEQRVIRMSIMNLNKQMRLYQQGLTPMMKTVPGRGGWERMRERPLYQMTSEGMMLTFEYTPSEGKRTTVYFAFCYPFSYIDCQKYLNRIERRLNVQQIAETAEDSIYYHRQLLCRSLDGLRVELLTVSSHHGITMEKEPHLPGLFPDTSVERARVFKNKKVIFITSRVHPGETPSSFVFNGFLEFILRDDDPRSKLLRQHFVFKMVPVLNPDGVRRGHYRTDSRGVNLNRMYIDPKWELYPAVFCVRSLIMFYHLGVVSLHNSSTGGHDDDPPSCDCAPLHPPATSHLEPADDIATGTSKPAPSLSSPPIGVAVYVDLHAHATKRGCFMYGNHFVSKEDHAECMLLPKLISLNSTHFDFSHCVFSERNMCAPDKRDSFIGKEGSGRVAIYKATGLLQSYTLECNYNSGARTNGLCPATMDGGKATPPSQCSAIPYKYTIANYEEVGRGLALAVLDLHQVNPWSRLPNTEFSSLSGLRQALLQRVQNQREKPETTRKQRYALRHWRASTREASNDHSEGEEEGMVTQEGTKNLEHLLVKELPTKSSVEKRFTISVHPMLRRHTSPSLTVPSRPQKFISSSSDSYLFNSLELHSLNKLHKYGLSTTVHLPLVQPSGQILHSSIVQLTRTKTGRINREYTLVPSGAGPDQSLNLLNRFAVIGQRLSPGFGSCPQSNSVMEMDIKKVKRVDLGEVSSLEERKIHKTHRKPRKSPSPLKTSKLLSRPMAKLSSKSRSYPPSSVPTHRPVVHVSVRKR